MFCLLLGACQAQAAPPKLEALFPAGGQAGSSFVMTANGRIDPDVRLISEAAGVFFVPTGKPREWQVTITPQAQPGLHLVYAANAEGASEPRWFSIGTLPEMVETEPNDEVGKGQAIDKAAVCINGRLDKGGDVDGFTLKVDAGRTLVGIVDAYALGSPVDVVAHVVDERGVRVATASDSRNLDPVIAFTAPKSGSYTVQLAGFAHPPAADVRFTGGATVVYRLQLSTEAVVTHLHPPAVTTTAKTQLERRGYNLDQGKAQQALEPAQVLAQGATALAMPPGALRPVQVVATAKAALLEKEPNNTPQQATPMPAGTAGGDITEKSDVDRYVVTLKKGDRWQAQVWSKRLGLPLDAVLKIEDPGGKVIATADDQSEQQPDPVVQWTAAADGAYQIVIQDLLQQGGRDQSYVLEAGPPQPSFEAKLADAKPLLLEAGKTASVKVQIKLLNGFKEPLVVRAANLPAGVHAPEVAVPEKGGDVELKLHAAINAPASGQLCDVAVWTKADPARMEPAAASLRGENQRGTSLCDTTGRLWLTVKAAK